MARWTASTKWAAGPALDGQRDMPLALRLSEGLGDFAPKRSLVFLFITLALPPLEVLSGIAPPPALQIKTWFTYCDCDRFQHV